MTYATGEYANHVYRFLSKSKDDHLFHTHHQPHQGGGLPTKGFITAMYLQLKCAAHIGNTEGRRRTQRYTKCRYNTNIMSLCIYVICWNNYLYFTLSTGVLNLYTISGKYV